MIWSQGCLFLSSRLSTSRPIHHLLDKHLSGVRGR